MGLGRQALGTCGWVSYASTQLAAGKPLPKGTRDVDWQSAAARWLDNEEIVFFGALKPKASPPSPRWP